MKSFLLTISCILTLNCLCRAQNSVGDIYPTAVIYAIDYSTGQEAPVNFDAAILFKDALINLVTNTTTAKVQLSKMVPGRKTFVVTQMNPETNGNAYQLVLQSRFLNQNITVYTFIYSADQNSLSFYSPQNQGYVTVPIQGPNLTNLDNCFAYGKFNAPQPVNDVPPVPSADLSAVDNTPVDVNVSASVSPPPLPEYEQPECPAEGYLWQPGYWAFDRDAGSYYWVPGVWVAPPSEDVLWTPPYWGYDGGFYVFHNGYWGSSIGFYGGVNYGYGYGGVGFVGGNWQGGHFRYNTAVVRVNTTVIHNVYVDRTVVVRNDGSRASFNGRGGVMSMPNQHEIAASRERHITPTSEQIMNQRAARSDRNQFASANGGRPATVASPRPLEVKPEGNNTTPGNRAGNNNAGSNMRQGMNNQQGASPANQGANNAPRSTPVQNNAAPNGNQQNQNGGYRQNGNQAGNTNQQGQNNGGFRQNQNATPNNQPAQNNTGVRPGQNAAPANTNQPGQANTGARQNQNTNQANPAGVRQGMNGAPAIAPSVPRAPEARQGYNGTQNNQRPGMQQAPGANKVVPKKAPAPVEQKVTPPAQNHQ